MTTLSPGFKLLGYSKSKRTNPMSDATQTQTLEQTLNKTDLGHYLYEYRKLFFGLIIAILVGVTGFVSWKESQKSNALNTSVKVFEFQNTQWKEAQEGKLSVQELAARFDKLPAEVQSAPVMVPVGLEMGKFLFDKGAHADAEAVLSKLNTTHPISAFFIGLQRIAVLEKLEKTDEAIAVLEKLTKMKDAIMAARIHMELGRLYLVKGDKNQARNQFDVILSTYPNDESAKLAKLYLSQIGQ